MTPSTPLPTSPEGLPDPTQASAALPRRPLGTPTAQDLKDALTRKYLGQTLSGEQWVCIEEARSGAGFDGNTRQCDFLAINTFRGRGMEVIGHEVKVSLADWKAELAQPEKAEAFARFCRRWFVVVPSDLASKIKDDVPPAWGLMSLSPKGRLTEVRKAPARDPEPVPPWWWVGWLAQTDRRQKRGVEDIVRMRVEQDRAAFRKDVDDAVEKRMAGVHDKHARLTENAERLREITGLDVHHLWQGNVDRLRQAWAMVDGRFDPERLAEQLRTTADVLAAVTSSEAVDAGAHDASADGSGKDFGQSRSGTKAEQ